MPGVDGGGEDLLEEGEEGGFSEAGGLWEGEREDVCEVFWGVRV